MSDVVLSTTESVTTVTVVDDVVQVAVTTNPVEVSSSTAGVQGASYEKGDPIYVTVRNATGATLAKGTIVYTAGAQGNHTLVQKAIASGDATSARTLGWVSADIANNADGLVVVEGYLDGIDTDHIAEGSQLYLSGTVAGSFTATKPVAPIHLVYVGVVTKSNPGNGRVLVKVQNGYELDELHDVLIVNPVNAQVLTYDSATDLWVNATNPADGVTSITATAPLTGGTITSTGSIGLDQTALSITKSQVSDFTSGTVTSASTAQQAGTAVFANTSGTATYATTSGTATFATNAGTATYSVNSGTAVYSTNSGTAVFATNASTAVTISGSIAQSQVTDLVTDLSGKANLAGGNALTGAQTITGTSAGSVVTVIKGASSQSADLLQVQNNAGTNYLSVNNVGSLLFGTGSGSFLSGANGRVNVQLSGDNVGLTVRAFSGQSADLVKIQNSSGSDVAITTPTGTFRTAGLITAGNVTDVLGQLSVYVTAASRIGQVIRGAASQTADLLQIQDSASSNLVYVNSGGGLFATQGIRATSVANLATSGNSRLTMGNGGALVDTSVAGNIPLQVQNINASPTGDLTRWLSTASGVLARVTSVGHISAPFFDATITNAGLPAFRATHASGQTGDILQINNNAAQPLSGFTANGRFVTGITGSGFTALTSASLGQSTIYASGAAIVGQVIRGAASQTGDLQQWQNSSGTVLSLVNSSGSFRVASIGAIAAGNAALTPGGDTNGFLLATVNAGNKGLSIRGAASQTANLQEWQNSAGTVTARVTSSGEIVVPSNAVRGGQIFTFQYYNQLQERNAGGELTMVRQTAASTNPGANLGRIYFRDGTNAGTLKLVVRAGAAGAETTILDNIPQ